MIFSRILKNDLSQYNAQVFYLWKGLEFRVSGFGFGSRSPFRKKTEHFKLPCLDALHTLNCKPYIRTPKPKTQHPKS